MTTIITLEKLIKPRKKNEKKESKKKENKKTKKRKLITHLLGDLALNRSD